MITSLDQAVAVQHRRRVSGKKGRAKAVRRWFKREYGDAVEMRPGLAQYRHTVSGWNLHTVKIDIPHELRGDFTGCRKFHEVHG